MKNFDIQNQVVIMCGISGSGKTLYASQLEKHGYVRLSTDAIIWETVGKEIINLSKEEQKRLFSKSRVEAKKRFIELLKANKKVVFDSTHCKRSSRDEIRNICSEFKEVPLFVYCDAEKDELEHRLSQRKGMGPDDLIVTHEEFSEYWNGFERPQEDETDFIFLNDFSMKQ